ncbi:MAG: glycosyltransferase [Gemmatimonadaceae bacterium]|nr:glycosyltransferase [Gemmatimonadaceae bacterium]MDQ3243640.1 glycosyltransferase [Gemmatimonadota bacterium]
MSVVVPAFLGYDTVLAALDSWEAQTCRSQLEIIVLCPTGPSHPLPHGQILVETGSLLLHEARAAGVRKATASYVIFAEDHCLPDADCAEAMLHRLEEGWDAVGPALRSGTPRGAVTQGSFLITYAEWMLPTRGPISCLPGHNAAMRRQTMIDMGPELEEELLAPVFLMRRLRSEGRRFYIEDQARMRHFDVAQWKKSARIFFIVGQGCGASRLRHASGFTRGIHAAIAPVTAARHFARGLVHYLRAGQRAGFSLQSLVTAGFFACVWACGESVGAWKGTARVSQTLWIGEIKPVSREQVQEESALTASMLPAAAPPP